MTLSARNEASTRTELIDTQLARAGWSRNRRTLIEEFLLKASEPDSAYGKEQFADYVLLGSDGEPHHEVHQTLAAALQEPSRLAAWHSELGLVT